MEECLPVTFILTFSVVTGNHFTHFPISASLPPTMPNYAQAAIQIRQKKEREAKEKEKKAEIESRNKLGDLGECA